jgi:hypothetical protein
MVFRAIRKKGEGYEQGTKAAVRQKDWLDGWADGKRNFSTGGEIDANAADQSQ